MTHYEERLEGDVKAIRGRIEAIAARVQTALADAVRALLSRDRRLAYDTILGDLPINREVRAVDRLCHAFVAIHLPSAGHLRFVSSVLRLNIAIERVGDYAVGIAREAVQLTEDPPGTVARDIDLLSDQNGRMFGQAMKAFAEGNAELARGTVGMARQLASTFDRVYDDLLNAAERGKRPPRDLFALLDVFNRLNRVGDQAKNICEETIFWITGESKQPKVYRVLFVDERNDRASLLAEGYARKAFPESGRYSSAGWNAADRVAPETRDFLEQRGYDLASLVPSKLIATHEQLNDYHVIVSLGGDPQAHLESIPFHTVVLVWDLPDASGSGTDLTPLKDIIATRVSELMETLRGEGAG